MIWFLIPDLIHFERHRIPDDADPQHCKNLWIRNNAHRSEGGYDPVVGACAPTAGRPGTGSPPPRARLAPAGPSRAAPQGCSAGSCSQGWKKPGVFKKPSPVFFFLHICPEERVFSSVADPDPDPPDPRVFWASRIRIRIH